MPDGHIVRMSRAMHTRKKEGKRDGMRELRDAEEMHLCGVCVCVCVRARKHVCACVFYNCIYAYTCV